MNLLSLGWKNIISKPLNVVLTMVLFALGIGLINFLLLLNHQLNEQKDSNLAGIDMVVGAKGSPLQMILCSMYHVDAPTGNISVKEARPFLNPKHPLIKKAVPLSLGDSYKGYRIVGTEHSMLELYNAEIGTGKLWTDDFDVTIGQVVADEIGLQIGDRFFSSHGLADDEGLEHEHGDGFKVVGILKPTGSVIDLLVLCNTESIWAVHDHEDAPAETDGDADEHAHEEGDDAHQHGSDKEDLHVHDITPKTILDYPDKDITSILVQFKSRTNFQALNMPRNINENTDMQAASPAYEINRLYNMIGVGVDALRNLAILIALVSAFSIFISLYSSLKERKYELSLMRVMGASPGQLFMLILIEGLLLAIIGCLLGLFISHVGMEIFANYAKSSYRYSLSGFRFLKVEWLLLAVSLLIGLVAAIIPAFRAYRTEIHSTLSK